MGSAYRKNLHIQVGKLLSLSVDLHTAIPSKEDGFSLRRYCPEHLDHVGVKQYCKAAGHEVEWGDWLSVGEIEDKLYAVDEATNPRPTDDKTEAFSLQPVDAKELSDMTVERGSTYYCKPSTTAHHELWTMLYRHAGKTSTALVMRGALRGNAGEKLYKLKQFRGYLALTELAFPESIKEPPESSPEVSVDKANQDLFRQVVENITVDVASLNVENDRTKKIHQWLIENGTVIQTGDAETSVESPSQAVKSLTEQLLESVEASKKG